MPLMTKPSSAATTSLIYITMGALILVWAGIWGVFLWRHHPLGEGPWYLCTGLLATGLTLLVIGMALGRIGRAARHAELPPPEVTAAEANATQLAAARAPMVAPVNPAAPVVGPNGQAVTPAAPPAATVPPVGAAPVNRIG